MSFFRITIIILLLFILFKLFKSNKYTYVTCKSCKAYNHRDNYSTCNALCKLNNPNSIVQSYSNNNYSNTTTCGCTSNKTSEQFANITDLNPILPTEIPNDNLYSNQDYVQQQNELRLKKLIFG